MHTPRNVNDGGQRPPRLAIYGNQWGLMDLPRFPRPMAWTFDQTLDRLVEAGFDGFQGDVAKADAVRARGLRFATSGRVNTPAEAEPLLAKAADAGADAITLHVGWGLEDDGDADALVAAVLEASARHDLPAFIETHRATIAQDIWRILGLIRRNPGIRFNGDYSHLYVSGSLTYPGFDKVRDYLRPILERTGFFHGRVSNGQSMQIDVDDGASSPHVRNFVWMWREAMSAWLKNAQPGDILPFAPELGPPSSGYSLSYTNEAGELVEISDRWQQTLVLQRLAQEAFAAAGGAES